MGGLEEHLRRRIDSHGPLSLDLFMEEALGNPDFGYYMSGDPFGRSGDFITAPETSQMFGELIGLWFAVVWRSMGSPDPVNLVELGPGRGTLMADVLRTARTTPEFRAAVCVHLVETSPVLKSCQRKALKKAGLKREPVWRDSFAGVPDGPFLLVANEFFDALPIRQFIRDEEGWRERVVEWDLGKGGFCFGLSPSLDPAPPLSRDLLSAPVGAVVEVSPAANEIAGSIGRRIAEHGGAALIVDYGHPVSAAGETLQAVKGHAYHDVLSDPGQADLTAHVDFGALARSAVEAGARAHGPVTQGDFLESLGISARARALLGAASAAQAEDIKSAHKRLVDRNEMGALFKVLALTSHMAPPPGFE